MFRVRRAGGGGGGGGGVGSGGGEGTVAESVVDAVEAAQHQPPHVVIPCLGETESPLKT